MVDILDAAHYIVLLSYGEKQYSLTHLKLQKLLYFAQGWSCVWDGELLFEDGFEPWQYGPVNRKVFEAFRKYSRKEIPEEEGYDNITDLEAKATLDAIWSSFGDKPAHILTDIACDQKPWLEAHGNTKMISNESIKDYFLETY